MTRSYHKSKRKPAAEPTSPRKLPPLKPLKPRPVYVRKPPADDVDTAISIHDINAVVEEVTHLLHNCPNLMAKAVPHINSMLLTSRCYWNHRRNYSVMDWVNEAVDMFNPPENERHIISKIKTACPSQYAAFMQVIRRHLREQP